MVYAIDETTGHISFGRTRQEAVKKLRDVRTEGPFGLADGSRNYPLPGMAHLDPIQRLR
jgi:hypothetical protein